VRREAGQPGGRGGRDLGLADSLYGVFELPIPAEALQAGMEENARQSPDKVFTILRTVSEGDFVVTHSHVQQNPDSARCGRYTHLSPREWKDRRACGI
jgi:hypothetical protein